MRYDFREKLTEVLAQRIESHPTYSLRAYARDLEISPGQLSLLLSKKRGVSPEKARAMLSRLGLSTEELEIYSLHAKALCSRSPKAKLNAAAKLKQEQERMRFELSRDAFQVISGWHHFSILQLLSVNHVRFGVGIDAESKISKLLGISKTEARLALARLVELELIEVVDKNYRVCHDTVLTSDGVPSEALRKFHRDLIQKAEKAIESQSLEERHLRSTLLPIKKSDLSAFQSELTRFHKNIMKKFGRTKNGDGEVVYALLHQLFKLSEEIK